MQGFLQKHVSAKITGITNTELEFALDGAVSPEKLLGEHGGNRGSGQTSLDVAFIVETDSGNGIILTECKYTEHSFYPCSARITKDSKNKEANPAPHRCMQRKDIPTKLSATKRYGKENTGTTLISRNMVIKGSSLLLTLVQYWKESRADLTPSH